MADKYNLELKEFRSNFPLGHRIRMVASNSNIILSVETIQGASASLINAVSTLEFECAINSYDEFYINKSKRLKRIFSKQPKKGIFLLDVKSKSEFLDIIFRYLDKKEWREINQANIVLKDEKFMLKATSYQEKDLNFIFKIIQEILDSPFRII